MVAQATKARKGHFGARLTASVHFFYVISEFTPDVATSARQQSLRMTAFYVVSERDRFPCHLLPTLRLPVF